MASDPDLIYGLYPWHELPEWVVRTEDQPPDVARRPSFTRQKSFTLSDTHGLNRNLAQVEEERLCYSSDGDDVNRGQAPQSSQSTQKVYPSERQSKVIPEIEAQDKFLKEKFGLQRFLIIPDGNCLYRAFAQALVHDQSKYMVLRSEVVRHIQDHIDEFQDIIEGDAWDFLKGVAKDSTWASYTEILAITQMLDINVTIVTGGSPGNSRVCTTLHHFREHGKPIEGKDTVWLSWLSNGHYDLVVDRKMPNVHYDKWVKKVSKRMAKDEKLAQQLAVGESGIGFSSITNGIKNLVSHVTGTAGCSNIQTDNVQEQIPKPEHYLQADEALARRLDEEERRAVFDVEFGDQYA